MKPSRSVCISGSLLRAAADGNAGAMETLRMRVDRLRNGSVMALANLAGSATMEQRRVMRWIRESMQCDQRCFQALRICEETQCQVFDLVYPLVAQFAEARNRVIQVVAPSPCTLRSYLRINREVTGAALHRVTFPFGDEATPFGFIMPGLGHPLATGEIDGRRVDESVALLLEAGADLEFRQERGFTPLLLAADGAAGGRALVASLLKRGANAMATTEIGTNILHLVAIRGGRALGTAEYLCRTLPDETLRVLFGQAVGIEQWRPHEMAQHPTVKRFLTDEAQRVWAIAAA